MKTIHTARVISVGGRNGRVRSTNGCIRLPLTAFTTGSKNHREGTTNPEELFGAAYSSCFGALLELVAEQQQLELSPNFHVSSRVNLQQDSTSKFHLEVFLDCYLPNISEADATRLIHSAHKICPYSNAIRDNVKITLNLLSNEEVS